VASFLATLFEPKDADCRAELFKDFHKRGSIKAGSDGFWVFTGSAANIVLETPSTDEISRRLASRRRSGREAGLILLCYLILKTHDPAQASLRKARRVASKYPIPSPRSEESLRKYWREHSSVAPFWASRIISAKFKNIELEERFAYMLSIGQELSSLAAKKEDNSSKVSTIGKEKFWLVPPTVHLVDLPFPIETFLEQQTEISSYAKAALTPYKPKR